MLAKKFVTMNIANEMVSILLYQLGQRKPFGLQSYKRMEQRVTIITMIILGLKVLAHVKKNIAIGSYISQKTFNTKQSQKLHHHSRLLSKR